jgi:hypothetical protein
MARAADALAHIAAHLAQAYESEVHVSRSFAAVRGR